MHSKEACIHSIEANTRSKRGLYVLKRVQYALQEAYVLSQKPKVHSQETNVHSKEAYLHSKEAYIHSKDAYIHSKKASTSMIQVKVGLTCLVSRLLTSASCTMYRDKDTVVDVRLLHYVSCHHTLALPNSFLKKSCCAPRRALLHCILLTRGIILAPA